MGKIQQFVNPENSTERFYPRTLVEAIADLSGSALSSKLEVLAASASVYLVDSASLKASASLAGSSIQPAATSSWATAAANSHTHSNKAVLDEITAAKTASWDSSATWIASNSSSALAVSPATVTASINAAIGGITASLHTHTNKAVLDGITAAKTASWDSAATSATALNGITASLIASGTLAKNVTAITASLVASASIAKTASSSAAALSRITASLVASASIAKTASSSAAALSSKSSSWATAATWVTTNSSSALAVSPASVTASIIEVFSAATASMHTHSNKALLDSLTNAKTGSWDAKLGSESDPVYLADSASLKASASLASSSYLGDITSLVAGATTGTITLAAGKFISSSKFTGNVTYALGTAFGTGRASLYAGKFKYNSNYSVTFPSGVVFADNTPELEEDCVYEFSILDGVGVVVKVVS